MRKQAAPPNLAAKALSLGQFKPKVAASPKAYKRKQKHKKGSGTDGPLPFAVPGEVPSYGEPTREES